MDQIDAGKSVCIAMPQNSNPSGFTSTRS